MARDDMKINYFKPGLPTVNGKDPAFDRKVDKKFQKGMKLQSLFDPAETRRIEEEELKNISSYVTNEMGSKKRKVSVPPAAAAKTGVHFSQRSKSTAVDFNKTAVGNRWL